MGPCPRTPAMAADEFARGLLTPMEGARPATRPANRVKPWGGAYAREPPVGLGVEGAGEALASSGAVTCAGSWPRVRE